jgi:phosphoserine phosphatase
MSRKAAFFKVEGPLVRPAGLPPATYFVLNQREMRSRVTRLGGLAAAAGLSLLSPLGQIQTATRLAWSNLRGMSEDRLHVLAQELYERQLLKSLRQPGIELLEGAKRDGCVIVLVSELLDLSVRPLADRLGADHLVANRMEVLDGHATGRLIDPIVAQISGQWAQAFAQEHDLDLAGSMAYGAAGGDALLMSAVGHPCAVYPDWRLRRIARDHAWPIVEADA